MKFKRFSLIILAALLTQSVFAASEQPQTVEVIFETTMGSFTLALIPEKAPKTVANFLTYVDEGFYKDTLFHRAIPRFVVQGGGFEKGMKKKQTHPPVENESRNGLKNIRGTISMARTRDPNSATSQFFINVVHNPSLDSGKIQYGYTVFGKVTDGMDVIDNMIRVPTTNLDHYKDVPKKDIVVLSAKRKTPVVASGNNQKPEALKKQQEQFIPGEHYIVLDKPVPTRDSSKVEVVEAFSYGCPHCYRVEPMIAQWREQQVSDVDFWQFPAVWSQVMRLYARTFYTAEMLKVAETMHLPLFTAILLEQKQLSNESELAGFFVKHGVDKKDFTKAYNSSTVEKQVKQAEVRVRRYKLASVPEIVVNGKYRVDPMRAGGRTQMLAVVDFLVNKERALLKKQTMN